MKIYPTSITDLFIVKGDSVEDKRGAFSRLYCDDELTEITGGRRIVQINISCTNNIGVVRGLHYQYAPHAEMKIVRCLKGRVWDVAVDLRQGSKSYLHWHAEELTPANKRMMIIPEGFAHGFQALEPESHLLYLNTAFYTPTSESGLRFDDPKLGIRWPLDAVDISTRDSAFKYINSSFSGCSL